MVTGKATPQRMVVTRIRFTASSQGRRRVLRGRKACLPYQPLPRVVNVTEPHFSLLRSVTFARDSRQGARDPADQIIYRDAGTGALAHREEARRARGHDATAGAVREPHMRGHAGACDVSRDLGHRRGEEAAGARADGALAALVE